MCYKWIAGERSGTLVAVGQGESSPVSKQLGTTWAGNTAGFSTSSVPFSLKMDESGKVSSWIWTYVCSEVPTTSFLDHQKLVWW